MDVGRRIWQVRKDSGLTLDKFGARIGIKKSSLSHIESGRTNPSEQTIRSISREFGVSEAWLRTGEGEKEATRPTFSLDEYARQAGASDLELEFIRLYLELPADVRETVITHFREGLSRLAPAAETAEERHERYKREAREEAEEYYKEILEEKKQADESPVSGASGAGGNLA